MWEFTSALHQLGQHLVIAIEMFFCVASTHSILKSQRFAQKINHCYNLWFVYPNVAALRWKSRFAKSSITKQLKSTFQYISAKEQRYIKHINQSIKCQSKMSIESCLAKCSSMYLKKQFLPCAQLTRVPPPLIQTTHQFAMILYYNVGHAVLFPFKKGTPGSVGLSSKVLSHVRYHQKGKKNSNSVKSLLY